MRNGGVYHEKQQKDFLAGILMAVLAALPLGMGLASVENHTESDENYKMSYPLCMWKATRRHRTGSIRIFTNILPVSGAITERGNLPRGNFSYQVRYEDGTLISLTLADSRYSQGAAHGYTNTRGLTYSKVTGEKLPLPYFVRIGTAD